MEQRNTIFKKKRKYYCGCSYKGEKMKRRLKEMISNFLIPFFVLDELCKFEDKNKFTEIFEKRIKVRK